MNDHIGNSLQSDASVSRYMHVGTSAIDRLIAVEDEFMLKLDDHAGLKNDPEGLILDDGMAKGAWGGVDHVMVRGVGDYIVAPSFATHSSAAKANGTVSQVLAVGSPVGVATPAVIDGIASQALGLANDWRAGEELPPS
ncbi:UNVERIFIED_CONTAM: hypothetical protein Scaly_0557700 [Sesamum calycinum]|uniref:Uncharacterized protein n=1 Tax=Sesamum calycinum TaxID=2727403 RepID=A0AAW2RRJ8_9LAMI